MTAHVHFLIINVFGFIFIIYLNFSLDSFSFAVFFFYLYNKKMINKNKRKRKVEQRAYMEDKPYFPSIYIYNTLCVLKLGMDRMVYSTVHIFVLKKTQQQQQKAKENRWLNFFVYINYIQLRNLFVLK